MYLVRFIEQTCNRLVYVHTNQVCKELNSLQQIMETIGTTLEHRMLTDTLGALGDGHHVTLSAEQGLLLLEGWLNALPGDVGAERILAELTELRDHLKTGHYDPEKIRHLLLSMASHTLALSHEPTLESSTVVQLRHLANALRNFTGQL